MPERVPREEVEGGSKVAFDLNASAGLFAGVSTFEDEGISSVPYAVDDAVDLAALFSIELGLVLPERTVLMLAGQPQKQESRELLARLIKFGAVCLGARMTNFYRILAESTQSTKEGGIFVFAAATHGVSDQGGDFLFATDSLRERPVLTGVNVTALFDEITRAHASRRLVLLDACRERLSHGIRGDDKFAMTPSFAAAITGVQGTVVLSGSTLGGFAYDDRRRKNGVFTAAVLDGLRGKAPAGTGGWITVRTLADFVQDQVVAWVRRNRPGHCAKSLGIARRIEADAEALPLAPHPEAMRLRQRYPTRKQTALDRFKENQGRVLTGRLGISTSIRKEKAIAPPRKSDQYHSWRNVFLGGCAGSTEMR